MSETPAEQASEAAGHADFTSILRYAQCWEDADTLLAGLDVQPGDTCLSIASAGENTLSLLTRDPGRVIAVDLNPAQIAALELRVAAFRCLSHDELLQLIGSRPSTRRAELYARCRPALGVDARRFWDARGDAVANGIGTAGKFEHYFSLFRRLALRLVHSRATIAALLEPRDAGGRRRFYDERWNTMRWRALFRIFFSQWVLGRLGRDPAFFRYVDEPVADHLMRRVRHALVELDPSSNPYATWIVTGTHGDVLPHALRASSFESIRRNIDRLEWHCAPIEALVSGGVLHGVSRANLSNIFEYISPANATALLEQLLDVSVPGGRLAYWNMMVPRQGSTLVPGRLRWLQDESHRLWLQDKAFFYRAFVVDEVIR
jgi:S-adenosylmethionine-diacylglycerol 3-amino-3-carboxypropyl transferase